ncbi:MAG: HAD-IIB family hydrolase [Clostridia bacterium]|nr:HAD-IIB family hydrolase [Clostridia bacterium]MBR5426927.1 HAD-IIB family hydrolase [Clostridia bacterium]
MKFEKCLIASDYDGTLYDNTGTVPAAVIDAIQYYMSEGGFFTVCTGRIRQGFRAFDPAYINAPVLLGNGAGAFDYVKNEYAFLDAMGDEALPLVDALSREFPEMSIELYTPEEIFAIHMSANTQHHFTSQFLKFIQIPDASHAHGPFVKIMLDAGERSAEVQRFLKAFGDDPGFLPTRGGFVEVLKKGVNKGSGLYRLADALGVPHDRTFAVGDGYNDADMLRAAKYGFVPANGSEEAKEAGDFIVRSNDEGAVAHVIELLENLL